MISHDLGCSLWRTFGPPNGDGVPGKQGWDPVQKKTYLILEMQGWKQKIFIR